jgi:hypothetical protein
MTYSEFKLAPEDRIIFMTDGVTQAGIGSDQLPFGWGRDACIDFVEHVVKRQTDISAARLSSQVVKTALSKNRQHKCIDDISCASVYFRKPRKMVVASGPPFRKENDLRMSRLFDGFEGRKVICGGTTATIIARELGRTVELKLNTAVSDLPPVSVMEGVEVVTEGILTLTELCSYLDKGMKRRPEEPVALLAKALMESDCIEFLIGTKVNEAHQDPTLPVDLEIRRNILKRIMWLLEEKFNKSVSYRYF